MSATRKWVPIAFGGAVFVVFVGISAAYFSVSWMREHLEVTSSSQTDATRVFDEARAPLGRRRPGA